MQAQFQQYNGVWAQQIHFVNENEGMKNDEKLHDIYVNDLMQ